MRFGAPRLLERFANPAGLPYPATSPRLVRLSSESVMLAWTGALNGHWVVRTAAIDLNGIGAAAVVSDPHADSLLSDLQPGPDGEALALWSEPQPTASGRLDTTDAGAARRAGDRCLARPHDLRRARTLSPRRARISGATVAFDPDERSRDRCGSDRARPFSTRSAPRRLRTERRLAQG